MRIIDRLVAVKKYNNDDFYFFLKNKNFYKFISRTKNIKIGFSEINFFKIETIKDEQRGYSYDFNGNSLIGTKKGDWKKSWIVIANDGLGCPIFVDFDDVNLPVFTTQHDSDIWIEICIANSLHNFNRILKDLKKMADSKRNSISKIEIDLFLEKTQSENNLTEVSYWEFFLE